MHNIVVISERAAFIGSSHLPPYYLCTREEQASSDGAIIIDYRNRKVSP